MCESMAALRAGGCGRQPAEEKMPRRDGPKAALLVRNGKHSGYSPVAPSSLTSGLRSERFNPPPIGSSRTGRQARPAAHQKSGRRRRHGRRPEEGRGPTPAALGNAAGIGRPACPPFAERGASRVVLQCTLRRAQAQLDSDYSRTVARTRDGRRTVTKNRRLSRNTGKDARAVL